MRYASLEERLLAMSTPDPEGSGCWLWLGARLPNGYGRMNVGQGTGRNGRAVLAHRQAYATFRGWALADLAGFDVHHTCGCRWCINPGHLELLEHVDNCQTGKRRNGNWSGHGARCEVTGKYTAKNA